MTDDSPTDDAAETNHNVNESHDKIRLEIAFTRGTGTRDQEKPKIKARGETPEEAAENLSESLRELEDRDVFERARNVGQEDA